MIHIGYEHCSLHIYISDCGDGDLRLMNGNTGLEGRLEICFHNKYGTICDRQFDNLDAKVACRKLGFSTES